MPMSMKNSSRKKSKTKRFLYFLLFFLIFLNGIIILSGKSYLYKGVKETYLKGRKGPGIYDSLVFPSRTVVAKTDPILLAKAGEQILLPEKNRAALEADETTSFLVLKDGEIVFEEYWEDHTLYTRSNSFSMAKSIIGLLVGIAIDEGHIKSFDEPISEYIDFFPNDTPVTIRHLLTMSSDLNWRESAKNPFSENAAAYYGRNLEKLMRRLSFGNATNERFYYASGNSQLLGFILENATGMAVSDYFSKKIWGRINPLQDALWSLDTKDGMEKAFCCLYATTHDYAKLGQLLLQQGVWGDDTLIQPSTLDALFSFATLADGRTNFSYGMHFWLVNHPKEKIVYARGILGQYIIVFPSSKVVVVRTGHQRKDKFEIPSDKINDKSFIEKNKYKIDHPLDLFEYVDLVFEHLQPEK